MNLPPSLATTKAALRKDFKSKRQAPSVEEREKASLQLLDHFKKLAFFHPYTLSFASFADEIDTRALNNHLLQQSKLILPTVSEVGLRLYHVTNMNQLEKSSFGILEPNPALCKEIPFSKIFLALIPGLAFDKNGHRIGYGKGYYDRLLKKMPQCQSWGVGFNLQQLQTELPTEAHDIPVKRIFFTT
jgi:5-formyltetrahydrofolate cyclo-ligase